MWGTPVICLYGIPLVIGYWSFRAPPCHSEPQRAEKWVGGEESPGKEAAPEEWGSLAAGFAWEISRRNACGKASLEMTIWCEG